MAAIPNAQDLFDFDPQALAPPPRAVADFVKKMIVDAQGYYGPEKRADPRYDLATSVTAVPIDEQFRQTGEAFIAVTRDVSTRGMALYHTRGISQPMLAVEMQAPGGAKLRVALKITRCIPVGRFYEIGGQFVTNLNG
jgi:hypothetical protein